MGGNEIDVLVVGAGVVGLTTAICLAESGLRAAIRTAAPPGASTSAAAGAVWGPVMTGPAGRVREWARTSLHTLRDLEGDPAAGIRSLTGRKLSRVPEDPPDWIDLLDNVRLCRDGDHRIDRSEHARRAWGDACAARLHPPADRGRPVRHWRRRHRPSGG